MPKHKFVLTLLNLLIYSTVISYFFLSFEESFTRNALYTVSLFIFLVFLKQFNKLFFNSFIIFIFILCILIYPVHVVYGDLTYMYVASVFFTDFSESISYLKLIPIKSYIFLLLLGFYCYWLIKAKIELKYKFGYLLIVPLLFLFFKKIVTLNEKDNYGIYFNVLPIKKTAMVAGWLYDIHKKFEHLKLESKKTSTWNVIQNNENPKDIVVLIVGESLRKDFLHSYGFPIKNTPFIDSSINVQFNNLISAAATTASSLSKTLALSKDLTDNEPYNNIITLTKKLGYYTYWLSSQEPISEHGSPIAQIALNADTYKFKNNETVRKNDHELLGLFKESLTSNNEKKFIVLHMIGSHPAIEDRVNNLYDEFILTKELSYYNKSVKNTDEFLKNINSELIKTNKSFSMIYFSDHGLGINNQMQLTHGGKYQDGYNVPLLIWQDNMKNKKQFNAARSSVDFLQLFCEILNIKTSNIQADYTFISEDTSKEIKVINNYNQIVKYKDLTSAPINTYLKRQ